MGKVRQAGLSAEQVTAYQQNPDKCPYCKSDSLEGEGVDVCKGYNTQVVSCCECGAEWTDKYMWMGITVHRVSQKQDGNHTATTPAHRKGLRAFSHTDDPEVQLEESRQQMRGEW